MKILILSTNTPHHLFFYESLSKKFKNINIILEKKKIRFGFKTFHNFYKKRDAYEKKIFFNNKKHSFKNVVYFNDINDNNCIKFIKKYNPKIIICFGIGIIKDKFLKELKNVKILNLHGGNPEYYRGLDSFMWSIYHNDFQNFEVTLHYVQKKIDTGKIVDRVKLKISNSTKLEELRILNTLQCIKLVSKFIHNFKKNKKIHTYKLKSFGRYYSAMPSSLVKRCIKNFNKRKK